MSRLCKPCGNVSIQLVGGDVGGGVDADVGLVNREEARGLTHEGGA